MHSGVPLFSSVAAFSTIAWDDLEEGVPSMRQERDSLGCQVRKKTNVLLKNGHQFLSHLHVNGIA